ncbi:MAG: DUF3299 domain-containing protein [Deltaproteobacteria bacterium]|jgi:hypothetical protein|nr:DUF3299 domain-containing protein [Deltaproteobacteria bacterium]
MKFILLAALLALAAGPLSPEEYQAVFQPSVPAHAGRPSGLLRPVQDQAEAGRVVDGYYEKNWLVWEELVPPEWQPQKIFEELKLDEMADNDPRAEAALEEFVKRWNEAPVNKKIHNKKIKIPGFVVPLDFDKAQIDEFLLVPYFGACIHVPPPPPNQIVHVRAPGPVEGLAAMDVVWVYGKITVDSFTSELGRAGYSLGADKVVIYQEGMPQ